MHQFGVQLHVGHDPKFFSRVMGVLLDLTLLGKQTIPSGVGCKRIGIQSRWNIATAIGVAVVTPNAANFSAFF